MLAAAERMPDLPAMRRAVFERAGVA